MGIPPPPRLWGHAYCRSLCRGHRRRRVPLVRRLRMGSPLPGCWGAEPRGWLLVHRYRSLLTSPSLSPRAATSPRLILPTDRRESSTRSGVVDSSAAIAEASPTPLATALRTGASAQATVEQTLAAGAGAPRPARARLLLRHGGASVSCAGPRTTDPRLQCASGASGLAGARIALRAGVRRKELLVRLRRTGRSQRRIAAQSGSSELATTSKNKRRAITGVDCWIEPSLYRRRQCQAAVGLHTPQPAIGSLEDRRAVARRKDLVVW